MTGPQPSAQRGPSHTPQPAGPPELPAPSEQARPSGPSDEILRSTVRLARLAFSAAAASVFLRDEDRGLLVFEASSGVGEDHLVGSAIPEGHGIAGWVAGTGETMIVRGVTEDDRFDREFALSTGLVPDVVMAVPMEHAGEVIGVLEVLDPKTDGIGDLDAMDLLAELAHQSTAALVLILERRRAEAESAALAAPPPPDPASSDAIARLRAVLAAATGSRAATARTLLGTLADLLEQEQHVDHQQHLDHEQRDGR